VAALYEHAIVIERYYNALLKYPIEQVVILLFMSGMPET